eukprot:CAMPEP_0174695180 /NCGR_PEP_ID=MMETSP1094-20130205/1621_1 /TAXON_ID=156173 /ORGANISM="Chrysochromulina brevifilum, Strain UTEX LB 985" /LENGTH=45 /DNA_ID= /DNA_START= /DNA_END= /DNA_ORIENTATION=
MGKLRLPSWVVSLSLARAQVPEQRPRRERPLARARSSCGVGGCPD